MDHEEFIAWVKHTFWPWQTVGAAGHRYYCPLANYLRAKHYISLMDDKNRCVVTSSIHSIDGVRRDNPMWAIRFIQSIDRKYYMKRVSRRQVLAVLREIPKGI